MCDEVEERGDPVAAEDLFVVPVDACYEYFLLLRGSSACRFGDQGGSRAPVVDYALGYDEDAGDLEQALEERSESEGSLHRLCIVALYALEDVPYSQHGIDAMR